MSERGGDGSVLEPDPDTGPERTDRFHVAGPARVLWGRWSRFWFDPRPASTLTLWRIAFGFTALCWLVSLSWDLGSFFGDSGIRPDQSYRDERLGLLQWWGSDGAVRWVWLTGLVTAVLVITGRLVRVAAPVLWYTIMSLWLDNTGVWNAGDDLLRLWALYFALFAALTPGVLLSLGPWGRGGRFPPAPNWMMRLVQIQITVIYPASVIGKLSGDRWWDGTAGLYALGLQDFERLPLPDVMRENLVLGAALTWSTLLLEALLPILLWVPRTRRLGIVAGLALHMGLGYSMRLGFFAWAMAIGYIAFLTPSESRRILGWLGRPWVVLRGEKMAVR